MVIGLMMTVQEWNTRHAQFVAGDTQVVMVAGSHVTSHDARTGTVLMRQEIVDLATWLHGPGSSPDRISKEDAVAAVSKQVTTVNNRNADEYLTCQAVAPIVPSASSDEQQRGDCLVFGVGGHLVALNLSDPPSPLIAEFDLKPAPSYTMDPGAQLLAISHCERSVSIMHMASGRRVALAAGGVDSANEARFVLGESAMLLHVADVIQFYSLRETLPLSAPETTPIPVLHPLFAIKNKVRGKAASQSLFSADVRFEPLMLPRVIVHTGGD